MAKLQRSRYTLPPLPWKENALTPALSAENVNVHHRSHHQSHIDALNRLLANDPLSELPLEELVRQTAGVRGRMAVFNHAAQAWNHAFYWRSLSPRGGGQPTGVLKWKIESDLGGYAALKQQLVAAALRQFGSGWVWLVLDDGCLNVTRTSNVDTPIAEGVTCLLGIDVWEHAYYVDYRSRRAMYVSAVIDRLLNWAFAAEQLAMAPAPAFSH